MVHQADSFFEQCYSADYDPRVTYEQRQECWAAWLEHYTTGQPPERIDYANLRLTAIESGEQLSPLPGIPTSAVGTSYTASFFALTSGDGAEQVVDSEIRRIEPTRVRDDLPAPPNDDHQCADVCRPRWYACIEQCDDPHGPCRDACETEQRTCLAGCF